MTTRAEDPWRGLTRDTQERCTHGNSSGLQERQAEAVVLLQAKAVGQGMLIDNCERNAHAQDASPRHFFFLYEIHPYPNYKVCS